MALGGGTFIAQNKILPGAYINFISQATANAALSDRGIAALALEYDWGADDEIMIITRDEFLTKTTELLGYDYGHDKLAGLRDLFNHVHTLVTYNLASGGTKAANDYATAKKIGTRGNDIQIVIASVPEDKFEVSTALGGRVVDVQVVTGIADLKANAYVDFKTDATLLETPGEPMINGANGEVDVSKHQRFLDLAESQVFNAIGVVATDETVNSLYATYAKRLRDEIGKKVQAVVSDEAADYEGVINQKTKVVEENGSLIYDRLGLAAATPVNQSALNSIYAGEFTPIVDYTQEELRQAILRGESVYHQVGQDVVLLDDINSLVSTTAEKGDVFKDNQTIRVIDQIANDIASVFASKYLGKIPNDQSGRVSLESDIVSIHENLQTIRAIENFSADDVQVAPGNDKKSVVANSHAEIVNTMAKLYMTTVVA